MKTMKRAVITGVRNMELPDSPMPEPKEDWVNETLAICAKHHCDKEEET